MILYHIYINLLKNLIKYTLSLFLSFIVVSCKIAQKEKKKSYLPF